MISRLYNWSRDGWQNGIPVKGGTYLVRWDVGDGATEVRIEIVHSLHDGTFAVWTDPEIDGDDPEIYPGIDSPGAQWMCEHKSITKIEALGAGVIGAVCDNCAADGRPKTISELFEVKSEAIHHGMYRHTVTPR